MGCVQDRGCSKSPGATWGEPSPQRQRPSSARDSATDGPHSSSRALNARKANDFQTHVHTAQGGGGNGKAETHNRQAWGKRGQPTPGPCVFPRSHSRSSVHRNLQGPPPPVPASLSQQGHHGAQLRQHHSHRVSTDGTPTAAQCGSAWLHGEAPGSARPQPRSKLWSEKPLSGPLVHSDLSSPGTAPGL